MSSFSKPSVTFTPVTDLFLPLATQPVVRESAEAMSSISLVLLRVEMQMSESNLIP